MSTQPQPLDTAAIQARHHLALDPDACGTCRRNVEAGHHPEHEQCNRRAMLVPAPDALDYEEILDTPEDERAQLPARFHIPVFDGNAEPNSWLCAVCWGDGWVTRWPCATAVEKGREVFAAEHHGERARWDGARLLAHIAELEQQLAACDDLRQRAIDKGDKDRERIRELERKLAELTMTPRERANAHCRALREAGDLDGAIAYAEAFEASEAHDATHPRI